MIKRIMGTLKQGIGIGDGGFAGLARGSCMVSGFNPASITPQLDMRPAYFLRRFGVSGARRSTLGEFVYLSEGSKGSNSSESELMQ